MAVYTEELNTNFNYPHINIYNRYCDGELTGYQARTEDGYVMYRSDRVNAEEGYDPETDTTFPVTWYYTLFGMPANYNFDNFTWVAILRSEVDENYIFGDTDEPEHEVM